MEEQTRPFTAEDIDEAEAAASAIAGGSFPSAFALLARAVLRLAPLAREALAVRALTAAHASALGPAFAAERIECGCPEPASYTIDVPRCARCGFPLRGTTGAVEARAESQRASGR